ncbi:hypothetical protein T261_6699 [Streptomyces lydicus]|nr:hypothetical protein T261_6699 [Streptomyces lydicus]
MGRPHPAANRLTWHSLRIDGSLCAEAAHASATGLSVAGGILQERDGTGRGTARLPVRDLNDPVQKGV